MHVGNFFYYGLSQNSLVDIIKTALWIAKDDLECDAFTSMTTMDHKEDFYKEELGFLCGDGAMHFYLVNWSLGDHTVTSNDIATILI